MTGRRKAVLALGALAAGVYLLLAWNEQVPGGWRLRNLVEPHADREARRQAAWRAERLEDGAATPIEILAMGTGGPAADPIGGQTQGAFRGELYHPQGQRLG